MDVVATWTGELAGTLRAAGRMTIEEFAARLGVSGRVISKWEADPAFVPPIAMQQVLDVTLEQAPDRVKARFNMLRTAPGEGLSAAETRLTADRHISAALNWIDAHSDWTPGTARRKTARHLAALDPRDLQDRGHGRGKVTRLQVAEALGGYYGLPLDSAALYQCCCEGRELKTSILTRPDWLDLQIPLRSARGSISLAAEAGLPAPELDPVAADAAARRVAEAVATSARLVNAPIYHLVEAKASPGDLSGSMGITEFVHYALTMDLLETELVDALASGRPTAPGALPLRDRYLPDTGSVLDLRGRLCAGGALALFAIARPAHLSPRRAPDYVLLVQERSGSVLNSASRLAVIPKAFHGPMSDPGSDTALAATLERELEEELFGRDEVDSTHEAQRRADPMHPSLLSGPMSWLMGHEDAWDMECTGYGLNLVSGNYEFASLIAVHDDQFWERFGGHIQANWESSGLRPYSSLDPDLLRHVCCDPAWSNEGLFAFLQGLRRLASIGGHRVDLPSITITETTA